MVGLLLGALLSVSHALGAEGPGWRERRTAELRVSLSLGHGSPAKHERHRLAALRHELDHLEREA